MQHCSNSFDKSWHFPRSNGDPAHTPRAEELFQLVRFISSDLRARDTSGENIISIFMFSFGRGFCFNGYHHTCVARSCSNVTGPCSQVWQGEEWIFISCSTCLNCAACGMFHMQLPFCLYGMFSHLLSKQCEVRVVTLLRHQMLQQFCGVWVTRFRGLKCVAWELLFAYTIRYDICNDVFEGDFYDSKYLIVFSIGMCR